MLRKLESHVRGAIEVGMLALVSLAPWGFGSTSPRYEFFLDVGLAVLMALWALRILLIGRFQVRWCPLGACLATLVVVATLQMTPMPKGVLRLASPVTATMYDQLLPDRPELVTSTDRSVPLTPPAGSTLSFDRGATRREVGRLLALLALFAIVRGNIDPVSGLKRLSVVATLNGSLLSLFGLVQAFSSKPGTIFWVYPTEGGPFGPFINRNHFAFYVNVCIGLGLGLLLGRVRSFERMGVNLRSPDRSADDRSGNTWGRLKIGLLLDPAAVAIIFALGLMISGVASSLSRGGFLALLGGFLFGMVVWFTQGTRRSAASSAILLVPAIALGLVSWLGYDQLSTRLSTLQTGQVMEEQRSAIWARALPVARDFLIWGTGSGTYEFADMLHRVDADDAEIVVDHAHNDYIELLVEGGLAQLVPVLIALVLIFRHGLKVVRRLEKSQAGGLATGALVGLVMVVIHSLTDFGMHIPSCAVLVIVLCSLLQGLEGQPGNRPTESDDGAGGAFNVSGQTKWAIIGIRWTAAALAAVVVTSMGLLIAVEGWRALKVQEIRQQTFDLDKSGDPSRLSQKVTLLERAVRQIPEDYAIHDDLVSAQFNAFEQDLYELKLVASNNVEQTRARIDHLDPALRELQRSRDLCPFRARIHMQFAEFAGEFSAADSRSVYLERAKSLAPGDPELWYRCGFFELQNGKTDQAWESWRHSLRLSDRRLPEILAEASRHLDVRLLRDRILPENPATMMEAATQLPNGTDDGRRILLEAALALFERRTGPTSADDEHRLGQLYRALGRSSEALATYRVALAEKPMQHAWRLELAELAAEQGQWEESRQELLFILGLQPENVRACAVLDEITRKIAEGR